MRHWEIPALLATVAAGGLTSLFAQGPAAPTLAEPTLAPAVEVAPVSGNVSPTPVLVNSPMPEPVHATQPVPAQANPVTVYPEAAPVYSTPVESAPLSQPLDSSGNCSGCSAPTAVPQVSNASCAHCSASSAPLPAPVMMSVPAVASSSCGCQDSAVGAYVPGGVYSAGHSGVSGVYGVMGSGSGVGSGLLSPVANSGGLHARYPYYNYRHSWYYQGPASQNVTIVW